jgi:RsiW-degrading membrane proteinase PrsW (M82 family)
LFSLAYAIQSYFFAGFCEELIKYFTINRLGASVMTSDWRSFAVYGVCTGCGFAMAENLLYTLSGGYGTAIARAFTAVPFHCTTGCLLGLGIAKRRHMQKDLPWWRGKLS